MSDLPFDLAEPLASRLRIALDVEGKLVPALDALGPLAGRDVALVDVPDGLHLARMRAAGIEPVLLPRSAPLALPVADGSVDAVVGLWSSFRGVDRGELAEADRALRPRGRLLVVHDYGRDDVSSLRPADAPEYTTWSHREGSFLRGAGFKLHVVHAFWTFPDLDDARSFLRDGFGARGEALGARLKRPRVAWNVAIYHRWRAGVAPAASDDGSRSPRTSG